MKIYILIFLLIACDAIPVDLVNNNVKPLETANIDNEQPTEEHEIKNENNVATTTSTATAEKESTTETDDKETSTEAEDKKSAKPYEWCPERSECKKGDVSCILCYGNEAFNTYPCRGFKNLEML